MTADRKVQQPVALLPTGYAELLERLKAGGRLLKPGTTSKLSSRLLDEFSVQTLIKRFAVFV